MIDESRVHAIERPESSLFTYYVITSILLGPLFFVALIPLYFRYHTMRYRFEEEGVQMRWGILFRKEISLTYARIQDIHLASNFIERWLGLARVQIQTASGSSSAEMTIEGVKEYELVRDFLYLKMRGVRSPGVAAARSSSGSVAPETAGELTAALHEVASALREVTQKLERRP